ncbi:hypothetical protein ACIQB5_35590 [Streptomyces sp. NPDC088560]|uniref:hypothetical protein n=1 Tax=Streptomyces sp. NPDC088560 TaxID=3365868 RepID=UPI003814B2EC
MHPSRQPSCAPAATSPRSGPAPSYGPLRSGTPSAEAGTRPTSTEHRGRRPYRRAAVSGEAAVVLLGAPAGLANASTDTPATGIAATGTAATGTAGAEPPYNFGSGYSAINGTYTSVSANWTQPAATCRGGDQQTGFSSR